MIVVCVLFLQIPAFGSESATNGQTNLLVNPNWESGTEGWTSFAVDEPDIFHGETVQCSSIGQDISLEGFAVWQELKLSGNIAVAPEDPTQKAIEMILSICDAEGNVIQNVKQDGTVVSYQQSAKEESVTPTYHEIILQIPPGAAFARAVLTIYKQSTQNTMYFECLSLEIVEEEPDNGFYRTTESHVPASSEPEPFSEPMVESMPEPEPMTEALPDPEPEPTTYTVTNLNIPGDAVSYNGHYYAYYWDPDVSWTNASSYCFINSGHLATITSAEEQAFLENAFPGTQGWIGASLQEDGSWQWTTKEDFSYMNWKAGEPNNQNGEEGYAHLYTDMQWNDLPDTDTTYHTGYYCEWDTDTVTYERDGLFGGEITDETRSLLEEGKGFYFGTGEGGFDADQAWNSFAAATDDYSADAWYYLGRIMGRDLRHLKDTYLRAMGAYERAVCYGTPLGWMGQGMLYLNGFGVPRDYSRAAQLFQRAIELGRDEGYCGLGILYYEGLGVEQDPGKAMEYFRIAAESSEFEWQNRARRYIGHLYFDGYDGGEPDYAQALEWYLAGALDGDGESCYYVGNMYNHGYGVEENPWQAAYWYELAASHGSANGCYQMGWFYEDGRGVEQDYTRAVEYYEAAADLGNVYGMYSLAWMYVEGLGTERDFAIAREWLQKILDNEEADVELKEYAGEELAYIDSEENAVAYENYETPTEQYYQYETQPWEDPYFIGYTQDGTPQYSYDTWEYETQPWEDPYFIGYTQDGTPQYSYDTWQYETQPWEDPYFIGYTQDGTPQYSY